MSFHHPGELRFFSFDIFLDQPLIQAAFTRQGGCSPKPWESLNMGGSVGDDPVRVVENRRRAFSAAGRLMESTFDVWQVHTAEVVCTVAPRSPDKAPQQADAILTDQEDVTLLMRFADCVPILLYDPRRKVVGLVHAGWQGTVKKVVKAAVEAMQSRYHTHPQDVLAAIGPSVGPCHYEVGEDVVQQVRQAFGNDTQALLKNTPNHISGSDGKSEPFSLDLWTTNRLLLEQAGVRQVQVAELCTACHTEDWFSHRAENGKTGRYGVLIGIRNGS